MSIGFYILNGQSAVKRRKDLGEGGERGWQQLSCWSEVVQKLLLSTARGMLGLGRLQSGGASSCISRNLLNAGGFICAASAVFEILV